MGREASFDVQRVNDDYELQHIRDSLFKRLAHHTVQVYTMYRTYVFLGLHAYFWDRGSGAPQKYRKGGVQLKNVVKSLFLNQFGQFEGLVIYFKGQEVE